MDLGKRAAIRFTPEVSLRIDGDDLVIMSPAGRAMRIKSIDKPLYKALELLTERFISLDSIHEELGRQFDEINSERIYQTLNVLQRRGFLFIELRDGELIGIIEPQGMGQQPNKLALGSNYSLQISRFSLMRRLDDVLIVEAPNNSSHLRLCDSRYMSVLFFLTKLRTKEEIFFEFSNLAHESLQNFLESLYSIGILDTVGKTGVLCEDVNPELMQWEFHDLLFHSYSRMGRQIGGYGGTYRFGDRIGYTPAFKEFPAEKIITLDKPQYPSFDDELKDVGFFDVIESRRTRYLSGISPLSIDELSKFLWFSYRVKAYSPANSSEPHACDASLRPVPGAGAMHEIDLYLGISRCDGLDSGFYHYNPLNHTLERAVDRPEQGVLIQDAARLAGLNSPPDVLIIFASRFNRISWKYERMSYAATLKNVGVLYNQMYLVATALGLSPCALGGGNIETFAKAFQISPYLEGSVGEFILSAPT